MPDTKPALVLHLATGGEPLLFALPPEDAEKLEAKISDLLADKTITSVKTKEGSTVTINFAHVAVAYVDDLQRKGRVFGLH
ncbi:hypothetical protein [Amycolatopsis nigrescens]|uniref:hypothetical protein n=1 Tax=Amycolatopsis nigrescens TaxID=381445 RepID=UPI00036B2AA1|nr:hypothetical protein [Amycolatopsis nigrescens]